jgi:shikimate dehydrogenase
MFGAGGAGSAIACALAAAGVRSIAIIDPQAGRAESLVESLRKAFPACDLAALTSRPANINMIVNASPVGMRAGDGLPGEIGSLAAETLVGDVVVSESLTPFIQHAVRHGCHYVTGRDMHSGQIDALMAFFASAAAVPAGAKAAH